MIAPFSLPLTSLPLADITFGSLVILLLAGGLVYCFIAIAALRRRLDAVETRAATPPPPPAADSPAAPAAAIAAPRASAETMPRPARGDDVSPEVLTVIAAAVHAMLGGRYRVTSVVPALPANASWSVEGRRDVFSSHQIR